MAKEYGRIDFRDQISRNKRNSIFLIIIISLFFVVLGYFISFIFDPSVFFLIMIISIIISMLYTVFSYYNSGKIAIASVGAKEASRTQ